MRKQILFFVIPVFLVLTVLLGGGRTLAQGPAGGATQAGLGPAFTYQGQLKDSAGNPVTKTCDFRFSLWDALSGGNQVGVDCTVTAVSVADGYFAAQVNSGDEFGPYAFTGDARWLEIAVQCAGDPGYTTLSPRQELTAAPYALTLRPGARVVGAVNDGSMSALAIENTDTSGATWGLWAQVDSTSGSGVFGSAMAASGLTHGVYGLSASTAGTGVYGNVTAATGVTTGVWGASNSTDGTGVYGIDYATNGNTYGMRGVSHSSAGRGVFGWADAVSGTTYGVYGQSDSTAGTGVQGRATATGGFTYGVYGTAPSPSGTGVYGSGGAYGVQGYSNAASGEAYGVFGQGITGVGGVSYASDGSGVYGANYASSGQTYGVYGTASSPVGTGVYGSGGYYGVEAYATATSGDTMGVRAVAASPDAYGVYGAAIASSGQTFGVLGAAASPDGTGVAGEGGAYGVQGYSGATSGTTYGVYGRAYSTTGYGVYGSAPMTGTAGIATATTGPARGLYGESASPDGRGVYGYASATSGSARGVVGWTDAPGVGGVFPVYSIGVWGRATTTSGYGAGVWGQSVSPDGVGVYGMNSAGYAGFFVGDVHVIGDLSATGAKAFKIDNPLDPAHQYLYHYSMESSEVLNQYSGNATLDANGEAWVQLPDWFAAINKDFRYQLTPVGAPAPGLYIAQEVQSTEGGSRFQIAGGPAGLKVSWQVTALRNDPYMRTHSAPVVEDKPADKQGTYLQPELYGQPQNSPADCCRAHETLPTARPAPTGEPE